MTIKLGSLFDGIGVFPLAAARCGITPVWASEIEKAPISITKRHFPDMAHLGDITRMDGGAIPPVHVLTFGSPCQNLSQIGNRDGLAGAKSSLFFQAIRIIKEMRDATDNLFPVIAVWENEGERLTSHGGSWMPNIGQAPDWHDGSVSSSWRILEADVPTKYYLSPAQCAHFLKLAEIAGCPPPKEIEALFLKQGGAYPSPDPFNASVCGHRPKIGRQKRSETASDYQLTLFPLF